MRSARPILVLANVALAALMVATLGQRMQWGRTQHDAVYVALAVATLLAWPLLRRRRLTTLLLASGAFWSTLTGLFLVYVTPGFGYGGWMRWWHGATSVAFLLAFFAHWARNSPRLWGLARRLAQSGRAASHR